MSKKYTLKKLNSYKSDLNNDFEDINTINCKIDELNDYFGIAINSDNTSMIKQKIDALVEPVQSDSYISSANSYIDSEISDLEREIREEEEAAAAATSGLAK
jgi:predicted RNase H-like nuclease (RuvC/YqgF family)